MSDRGLKNGSYDTNRRGRAERCICPTCGGRGDIPAPLDLVPHTALLVELIGGAAFSTRELIDLAELVGGELHDVLVGREPRQIGRALERLIATQSTMDGAAVVSESAAA